MPDPTLLDGLNEPQREAVLHDEGPLLVVAGPGSGKTRVITFKIAHLLATGRAAPHNILAITFTNKAAEEMRRRVFSLLAVPRLPLTLRTFHSLGLLLLRRHPDQARLPPTFSVLDENDCRRIAADCLKTARLDHDRHATDTFLELASLYRNTLRRIPVFPSPQDLQAFHAFQKTKRDLGGLDFDDLLEEAVRLLRDHTDLRDRYRRLWTRILVDEYQDVNPLQYELLKLLAPPDGHVTVVGDDDQCVYEWRGASPEFLFRFEQDFHNVRTVTLDTNYRSTGRIVAAAAAVIARNPRRKPKNLHAVREDGPPVTLVSLPRAAMEGEWILAEMDRLRTDHGYSWRDFAVFYRTNHQSGFLEKPLLERRIPYRVLGGIRFFEREEIRDITAYLRLLFNPADEPALRRIVNTPERGLGPKSISTLLRLGPLHAAVDSPASAPTPALRRKLETFRNLLATLQSQALHPSDPATTVLRVIDLTGYRHYLDKRPPDERDAKLANLDTFVAQIQEASRNPDWTLKDFLDEAALFSAADTPTPDQPDKVSLITLHNAKGLEFPVVFITGLEEGLLPIRSAPLEDSVEEERRLCYVGMTRAKDRLYLLTSLQRVHYGRSLLQQPSRFLRDIPKDLLDIRAVSPDPTPAPALLWRPGDRVLHPEYGQGTVLKLDLSGPEPLLVVDFDGEPKRLFPRFTPLRRLEPPV